jgi:hypothetical protein
VRDPKLERRVQVVVYMTAELRQQVRVAAAMAEVDASAWIRAAIADRLGK